jgi:SCY1-like protein 2
MGSDLFSNYTIEKTPFLQGGYLRLWKIYHGTHKVRKQEVCVFVFEKKSLEKYPKQEQGEILLTLKCEAQMLVKFKHPSLLGVVESFVEDKNTLGFVTERFDYSLNSWMMNVKPSKLEIKQMVIELAKAILFLHNDAHVVHNNLNPDVIFIDANNKIKISGLSFSIEDPPLQGGDIDVTKYNPPSVHNINNQNTFLSLPDLSFVAPELIFNNKSFYSSDMFSLGLVIYQILKDHLGDNKTHLFMKLSSNSINAYKNFMNSFDSYLSTKLKFENDDNFLLSKLLQKQYNQRPRVRDIIDTPWFNDPKLKALNFIMNLESNDQKKMWNFLRNYLK